VERLAYSHSVVRGFNINNLGCTGQSRVSLPADEVGWSLESEPVTGALAAIEGLSYISRARSGSFRSAGRAVPT
jgi:hypothetical protein